MINIFFSTNVVFPRLAELDLSDNDLFDGRTVQSIYTALGRVPYLKNLTLTNNYFLDLCHGTVFVFVIMTLISLCYTHVETEIEV